jgi:hypothetical protein
MSQRDFERGPDFYRRRGPTQKPRRTFLIVTEGEKTEPSYFEALRNRLHLTSVEVHVYHPEATDPRSLTEEAIRISADRKRRARNSYAVVPYDEVWVVYDLEKTGDERRRLHRSQQAKQKACGLRAATSDPSFEFWLLLHFRYTTCPFPDCRAVIKQLKRHLPEYEKRLAVPDLKILLDRTKDAIKNADTCRKHHRACNGSGNPSTEMDVLVRSLDAVASTAFRILP